MVARPSGSAGHEIGEEVPCPSPRNLEAAYYRLYRQGQAFRGQLAAMLDRIVSISVVIPTYKREDDLVRTIRSVLAQPGDFEIVVVDQTSDHTASTQAYLESIDDPRFHYHLVGPPSLTAARNYGIEHSAGDVVVFVDDDVELHEGFLVAHAEQYHDVRVGAVAGRVIGPSEPPDPRTASLAWTGFRQGSFDCPYDAEATLVRGCNMSFRRRALEEAGGFDGRFMGNAIREDFDAALTVAALGWRVVYRPAAALDHHDAATGGCHDGGPYAHDAAYFRNVALFFVKHRRYGQLLAYSAINLASAVRRRDASHFRALLTGVVLGIRALVLSRPVVCADIPARPAPVPGGVRQNAGLTDVPHLPRVVE